jgi:hypothetical protein
MSRFTTLTKFTFEPVSPSFAISSVAVAYTTPPVLREKLQNMALLQFLRGNAKFYMVHDSTEGTAVIRLTDGINIAYEQTVSLADSPVAFENEADLSGMVGGARLYWEVNVTAAGSASSTAKVVGSLSVETPLFVSSGQC